MNQETKPSFYSLCYTKICLFKFLPVMGTYFSCFKCLVITTLPIKYFDPIKIENQDFLTDTENNPTKAGSENIVEHFY